VSDREPLRAQRGHPIGENRVQGHPGPRNTRFPSAAAPIDGLTRVGGVVVLSGRTLRVMRDALAIALRARRLNGLPDSSSYVVIIAEINEAMAAHGQTDVRDDIDMQASVLQPMSVEEAAGALGISRRQARRLAPKLGGRRIGGRWMLGPQAVREHMEGQKGKQ